MQLHALAVSRIRKDYAMMFNWGNPMVLVNTITYPIFQLLVHLVGTVAYITAPHCSDQTKTSATIDGYATIGNIYLYLKSKNTFRQEHGVELSC